MSPSYNHIIVRKITGHGPYKLKLASIGLIFPNIHTSFGRYLRLLGKFKAESGLANNNQNESKSLTSDNDNIATIIFLIMSVTQDPYI